MTTGPARPTYEDLARASRAERKRVFESGTAPEPDALVGWEFRGWNTSFLASLLRIRKFIKVFFAVGSLPYGCNTPTEQNALEDAWSAKPSEQAPRRYAFFAVEEPAAGRHPNAAHLDYGEVRNDLFAGRLRDYLVRVSPDSDDLLLGKAYAALGSLRIPISYFVLERRRPLPDAPELPQD